MIHLSSDEKELQIMGARLTFLKVLPLQEIDNLDIQLICKSYRNDNSSLLSCLTLLRKHDEYFNNWLLNNRFYDYFYFKKKLT